MTMSFKWQDKHMELFLETYKQYECLWNNKCINYSKANAREKAYALMLRDLNIPGLTVPDIKAKIKTIRTRYGAELTKIRNSEKTGPANEIYEPRLFWFKDADSFLRNVCTTKSSYLTIKDLEAPEKEKSPCKGINGNQQHCEENESISPENSRSSPVPVAVVASPSKACADLRYQKNFRKRSLPSNGPTINTPIKISRRISYDNRQDLNEFDVFCESLAIQLKKMPLQRALICQEKLQSVMTQERLFQLSGTQASPSTISSTYIQSLGVTAQNSEDYSAITSPGPRIDSVQESETYHYQPNEDDSKSDIVSEIKWEI